MSDTIQTTAGEMTLLELGCLAVDNSRFFGHIEGFDSQIDGEAVHFLVDLATVPAADLDACYIRATVDWSESYPSILLEVFNIENELLEVLSRTEVDNLLWPTT